MTVNEYIQRKVQPEYRAVMASIRRLIRETAPKAEELISYGMPCYKRKGIFAYLNASKTGITLSFVHGKEIDDKYGLLKGRAKWARYVRLRYPEDINRTALKYYIKQAFKLDAS
jgi:hypothetical protein